MDLLHSWGVNLAVHLQTEYSAYENWFQLVSSVADLHTTFFIFFPIWFHLKRDVSIKLIWVAVVGDWFNLVLKWVLFGERPYWWVHETRFYGTGEAPALRQVPITCETGPVLSTSRLLQMTLWMLFGLVELQVCMSRVYVAAHFPHQVISGVISGVIVAEVFSRQQWIYHASLQKYFNITLFLLIFAVGFYVLLKTLNVDLLWTLEKAQKWCNNPTWVHMDTSPFASLLRNMGTLFGLGLGLHLPLCPESKFSSSALFRVSCIGVSLVFLQFLDSLTFSSNNQAVFYLLSFFKSAAALLVPTTFVPGGISLFLLGKKDEKTS
ncbi:glucose-6-phosphatase a, catalytic subunit, tandem duplicate 1 isoform X1 [Salminus brasiliensis]|uniref:glucose-6-phosphatase a, catalytic subunit, tandem duplicate 1 isoform X1 n=1 Tax=Salminus brasiliensis TaxID=930266 RepID=UPI003B835A10